MPTSRRYAWTGELPGTIRRSCHEAQTTFTRAHRNAVRIYGEGDRANRSAFATLKRGFEKRGDHWVAKCDSAD